MDISTLIAGIPIKTVVTVYVVMMIVSAAVQSLPDSETYGGVWYKAFCKFMNLLIQDYKSFSSSFRPKMPSTNNTTEGDKING